MYNKPRGRSAYIKHGSVFNYRPPNITQLHNEKLMLHVGESVSEQRDAGPALNLPLSSVCAKYKKCGCLLFSLNSLFSNSTNGNYECDLF